MDHLRLKSFVDAAPAMRLLRAGNLAYVAAFLYRQFKSARSIAIPHSELLPALATFREEVQEHDSDALRDRPDRT